MKLTVTELRQVIREVIAESPAWWEKNWAEDEEDEDLEGLVPKSPKTRADRSGGRTQKTRATRSSTRRKESTTGFPQQSICISDQLVVTKLRRFLPMPTPVGKPVSITWKPRSRTQHASENTWQGRRNE